MKLKSGHEIVPVAGKELEDQIRHFASSKDGAIRLQPGEWFFPPTFKKYADRYFEFKFKPSDVVIMTYPKCGTTWMQEIVWTMKHNKSFDHPDGKNLIMSRSPFLDFDFIFDLMELKGPPPSTDPIFKAFMRYCPEKDPRDGVSLQLAESIQDPRIIKVHIPFSLLNPDLLDTCKVIFVARNPKDACLSYHHHHKLFKVHDFYGKIDQFIDYFVDDALMYSPFWGLTREAWQRRKHPNLLFCYYEEMKENPRKNLETINEFLGTDLNSEEIDKVLEHTSFSTMKKNEVSFGIDGSIPNFVNEEEVKKEGGFFRKGKAGDWKSKLTLEQEQKINMRSRKNLQDGFDSDFLYWDWF